MTPERSPLAKFGLSLRVKRNMVIFGTFGVGAPAGLCSWDSGELRGPGVGLFMLVFVLFLLGGALWGWLMWPFFAFHFPSMRGAGAKNDNAGG